MSNGSGVPRAVSSGSGVSDERSSRYLLTPLQLLLLLYSTLVTATYSLEHSLPLTHALTNA